MQNKKNTNVDLKKKSIFFFQLGLILSLFLVWQLIEWKVNATETSGGDTVSINSFEDEEIPITVVKEVTPPEVPREIVEVPKIIDNDKDLVETVIASTEETDIAKVEDIKVVEPEEPIEDYNIISVEEVPVFPGCENLTSNSQRRDCMSEKISQLVNRKFDSNLGEELGLHGVNRIYVQFRIDETGNVSVIGARAPHPRLEAEAERVIELLPVMKPGRQGGKPVRVLYSLPIIFQVQE
ncbi:energy transducer TonB [Salinimicrobium soli]|uniref:energy transducer TonB n=1 Tax=Salinimicrobium soli TaxID=1254399 RepID=UPI003AAF04CA